MAVFMFLHEGDLEMLKSKDYWPMGHWTAKDIMEWETKDVHNWDKQWPLMRLNDPYTRYLDMYSMNLEMFISKYLVVTR